MSILPGSVDTSMLEGSDFSPLMTPEDVAKTIVFAALDAPSAMNGSSLEMFGP
jgi:3-oxoacyl-[acyl-carrier protein] reductase